MWKDFFYFSNRERYGLLLLIVFIVGIFIGKWLFTPPTLPSIEEFEALTEDSSTTVHPPAEIAAAYHSPDQQQSPNRYQKQSSNERWRNNNKPQEEKRTYYQQENQNQSKEKMPKFVPKEKLQEGTTIELNAADTTQLKMIPGIGSSYASRIAKYRNLLGGYHSLVQLQEVHGMYEELYEKMIPFLTINPTSITKIPINSSSVDKLKAHPYINFYQAKAIVEMRKKKGKLTGVEELQLLDEFTENDWRKITPYLNFNITSDK